MDLETLGYVSPFVSFTGPDSKGRKPNQGRRWKEKSMKGMRAVADPSPLQPEEGQQQGYVGLKKTLELDDDGNGNKWSAHEYTPLLPSYPPTMVVISSFPRTSHCVLNSKKTNHRPRRVVYETLQKWRSQGWPQDSLKSPVWEHMTKVHMSKSLLIRDGSQRKKPCYKVMYVICHHCDRVFNADSGRHGTNNLSKHLDRCNCNCTHSL